jgi:hypothetical protein
LSKLKLDERRKKWVEASTFNAFLGKLINNYSQARGCMMKMEARLMTGRLGEFNWQFHDNVDRGVFKQLTAEEARAYTGPVNYISMEILIYLKNWKSRWV